VSGLTELSQRLARIEEISGVMSAMKSLALVETRKLARFLEHQRRMLANIEAVAADFLSFHPLGQTREATAAIVIVIGSERGFCGNFNERVLAALDALPRREPAPMLVVLGQRLVAKTENRANVIARIDGPSVAEDVPNVLNRLMDALHAANRPLTDAGAALMSLAHEAEGEPVLKHLLPLAALARRFPHAPRLQLAPPAFFAELLDQYLLAAFTGLLYDSLAAENRQRLAHMEQALDRLGETLARLALQRNRLRQEKIVEEIEVILSSEQALRHEPR
jgi:F-type H+-transporting ATPase subunit gamma